MKCAPRNGLCDCLEPSRLLNKSIFMAVFGVCEIACVMCGDQEKEPNIWSHVSIEDRIPAGHPLRGIRLLADEAL